MSDAALYRRLAVAVTAMTCAIGAPVCLSQTWPSKPARILVGFAPGGGVDTAARITAASLSDAWGQTVIVENRPGAAGNIATELTARAAPDGYTMVLCNIGTHGVTPARFGAKLTYDPIADFAFPAFLGGLTNVLMVHPSFPAKSLKEFLAYARKHPGKISYGSSGVGASPHMSMELLRMMTGINIVHVPYKGAAAALADLLSGNMEASVGNLAGGPLGAIRAGRVRALGVTSSTRTSNLPDVPTFAEQGIAGFDVSGWYGLCTQAKVPAAVITRINTDVNRMLAPGQVLRQRLEEQAIDVTPTTPEAFAAMVKVEIARWTKVVREAKLEGD
jgi:tripartite-type tricarboxylate transporter receptor subunit TctC